MIQVTVHPSWSGTFPGARMGLLEARGLEPLPSHPALESLRQEVEEALRVRHAGKDRKALKETPALKAYETHYKAFGKSYHVLSQIESVAWKGRAIPSRICAVTAMFMTELAHGLLTAGHDLARLPEALVLGASTGTETYINLSGAACQVPPGDMALTAPDRVISTVLHGPEEASPIQSGTRNALYTLYLPAGCPPEAVEQGLADLARFIRSFSPGAVIESALIPGNP